MTPSHYIVWGLLSLPVKANLAAADERLELRNLHRPCRSLLKQTPNVCAACAKPVPPTIDEKPNPDLVKGYEQGKGSWVILTTEEIAALADEKDKTAEVVAFIPAASIDPVYFAKSYNLEPADAPTSKPFSLLRATMERESMVAIIEYKGSGRDKLGAIRVTPAGLMLHELYYAAEVRAFSSKTWKPDIQLSEAEHRAAAALLQQFRTEWTPEAYVNKYNARAAALIQSKQDGQVIEVQAPTRPTAKVVDLADALTQSLALRSAKAADVDAPKPAVPVKAGKTKKGRAA